MKVLQVEAKTNVAYPVVVRSGGRHYLPEFLKDVVKGNNVLIITDSNVNSLYAQEADKLLQHAGYTCNIIELPAGETYKVYNTVGRVYNILKVTKIDRSSLVIALGGGVVGDLAGFAAATWQRGVPFMQVPTSLLAQVDSSIGGKVAVNHLGVKNLIGAFHHPQFVLIDPEVLETLPEQHYSSGMAEVIKMALLAGGELLELVKEKADRLKARDTEVLTEVIHRCLAYKAAVVERDPEDHGERQVLNLGHTLGHALEAADPGHWEHGEAVSIGLHFTLRVSELMGLAAEVVADALALLRSFGLPTHAPGLDIERVISLFAADKKAVGGETRWVMLRAPGEPFITDELPVEWKNILAELLEEQV